MIINKRLILPVLLGLSIALFGLGAEAQQPSPVGAEPIVPAASGVATEEAKPTRSREVELEDEVRELRTMVRELSNRVEQLTNSMSTTMPPVPRSNAGESEFNNLISPEPGRVGVTGPQDTSAAEGGSAAARGPLDPRRTTRFNMPGVSINLPTTGIFGPGFQLQTKDEEFQIQIHNLTQVDGRFYTQGQQVPVTSTFLIPREWVIFSGRLTRPFEYYISIAEGIDNLNILDVFLNVNFDPRLQFKIGRYKTPFTYEFYGMPINGFITPERSLFFNNFGLNRDIGLMAWGQMFDSRFDYALAIVNGTRNGYVDSNDFKDFAGLVNFRPFATWTDHWLENFNIGGSTDTGLEQNTPVPQVFRTNVATTGNLAIGPQFLALNKNVNESGLRAFWSLHMAYYYRHLSIVSEWQSGFDSYALANQTFRTRVPVESFYVMAGYFLTGETVSSRGVVNPLHNFDVRRGKQGLGALELAARYNYLNIGRQIFTSGLADPNMWTNQVFTVDLGINWYWNQYIKVYLGWQHAGFGNEVLFAPERFHTSSDQYWMRFQVFF